MILLENERKLIEERIQKIIEAKETAPSDRKIVIAGGIPVLEEHEKEIKALKDMLKIIDNNFKQDYKNEYLALRDLTKLSELNEKDKDMLASPDFQRKEELRIIETRMNGIETKYFSSEKAVSYKKASNGKEINSIDLEEYESFLKMKDILNRGMSTYDYYEYLNLREKTRMVPMSEGQYEVLMGKPAPYPREKKVLEAKEESLVVNHPEYLSQEVSKNEAALSTEHYSSNEEETVIDVPNLNEETTNDSPTTAPPELPPKKEEQDEELEEVVKSSLCSWLSRNKKKILIGIGLTAVAISAVVVITQLLPAITAAYKAAQVAGFAGQMISNGSMWWTATASEQVALHGANTALANMISGLTGVASNYTASTGVWTIAGQALPQFVNTATATAAAAAGKVSLLQIGTSLGFVSGLGSLGAGLIPSKDKKKSSKYFELKNSIEKLKSNIKSINGEDRVKLIQSISNKIIATDNISERERDILFRKLRKVINKNKVQNDLLQEKNIHQGNENEPIQGLTENSNGMELMDPEMVGIKYPEFDKTNAIDVEYVDVEEQTEAKAM